MRFENIMYIIIVTFILLPGCKKEKQYVQDNPWVKREVSFGGASKSCDERKIRDKMGDIDYYTRQARITEDIAAKAMYIDKAKAAANELKWAERDCGK